MPAAKSAIGNGKHSRPTRMRSPAAAPQPPLDTPRSPNQMLSRIGCYPRAPRGGVPRRVGPLVARWRVPCPPSVCFSGERTGTLLLSGAGARHWTMPVRTFLFLNRRSFCIWGSEGVSGAIAKPFGRRRSGGTPAQQKRSRGASVTRRDPCKGSVRSGIPERVSKGRNALRGSAEGRALCPGPGLEALAGFPKGQSPFGQGSPEGTKSPLVNTRRR